MRKNLHWAVAAIALMGAAGCEDGPDQVYNPSPAGAGDRWNNGRTPGAVDKAQNGFTDNFGGTSKLEICSGSEKQQRWAKMVNEPIKPPRFLAGIDVAGGDLWPGLLFEDAEKTLCQSDALGTDGEGSLYAAWGDAGEVQVGYNLSNHKINFIYLGPGYKGAIDFKSAPCEAAWTDAERNAKCPFAKDDTGAWLPPGQQHSYHSELGKFIQKNGANFKLEWDKPGPILDKEGTELFDALMYTFAPELPRDNVNCRSSGQCRLLPSGDDTAVFGARNIGFYFHLPSVSKSDATRSSPDYFYLFPVKTLPFSPAAMRPKLDAEGPTAVLSGLGDKTPTGSTCTMKMGMTWQSFRDTCVEVLNDPQKNQLSMNKLLGNLTHTHENFILDVVGVNLDFQSEKIMEGTGDIIHDEWVPEGRDTASEYIVDIRAGGPLINEANNQAACLADPQPRNAACASRLRGTGAIYREYALQVQEELNRMTGGTRPLADPACLLPDPLPANFDVNAWRPAAGCTGMEGFIIPQTLDPAAPANIQALQVPFNPAFLGFTTLMRPGDPIAMFCADAGTYNFTYCGGPTDNAGLSSSLWDGTFKRVLQVLGRGQILNLPPEARDRKFYLKIFARAYIKYLMNAATFPNDLRLPASAQLEPDHLIFDDLGYENEKFEYIDRRFVTATDEPLRFQYEVLIISGNHRDQKYQRRMGRAEKTLYQAMAVDKTLPAGARAPACAANPSTCALTEFQKESNVRITNLIGSPVLRDGWTGSASCGYTSYQCATDLGAYMCDDDGDPGTPDVSVPVQDDCLAAGGPANGVPRLRNGQVWLDDYGRPLLTNYKGAFGEHGTIFQIGSSWVKKTKELPLIRSAQVTVPGLVDPYAPGATGNTDTPINTIADWLPKSPSNGFYIPINGQRYRFITSETLAFGGATLGMRVYGDTGTDGSYTIKSVGSTDYMGDLFLCKDPLTNDLLRIEMFESMEEVLKWINGHPGSYEACGFIITYSPYNNYPLFLVAQKAGVLVSISTGSGFGRIASMEAWDPNL
jgi:hypothetical protein